jgi:diaminopimelate epimerase
LKKEMRLEKYHGLGNDFLIVLDADDRHPLDGPLARRLCDRHRGVGADGIIRVTAGGDGADVVMELRNADGGRAETSGNGLRCVAQAAVDAGMVEGPVVRVRTDAGLRTVTLLGDGRVRVEMGRAVPGSAVDDLPGSVLRAAAVDMGNPHVVLLVDAPEAVRTWPVPCTEGYNVEVVALGPELGDLTMRVWERGVGETQACGSGACAAAVAALGWGLVGERVTVHQPGGDVEVDMAGPEVALTGPVERVCTVEVPWR